MDASRNAPEDRLAAARPARWLSLANWGPSRRLTGAAIGLALSTLVLGMASIDPPVSSAFQAWDLPGDLAKAINLGEVFGHSLGAAAILLSVFILSPSRRSAVWVAIVITFLSGITANASKGIFARVRPHSVGSIRLAEEFRFPGANSEQGRTVDEGVQLVPYSWSDSRQRSFPSGHAATAWGLAIGLSLVFRRGVGLFALFASVASLQRITSGAHYPTDVVAGAAIACLVAAGVLWLPPIRRLLTRSG
jgi:membrane-associated phospholipid phosphatase